MNKKNVFIIDEEPLLEAIRKYGKGHQSKDYEYAVSIYMKRKLEESYNAKFSITFEVIDGKKDSRRNFHPKPEETIKILRNTLKQDTPIDFGLVRGTIDRHDPYAFAFQVKKFIGHSALSFNDDLLTFINKVLKKFRPGEVNLIIIPDLSQDLDKSTSRTLSTKIDIGFLKENIQVPDKSFISVFIFTYDNRPIIFQIWPNH